MVHEYTHILTYVCRDNKLIRLPSCFLLCIHSFPCPQGYSWRREECLAMLRRRYVWALCLSGCQVFHPCLDANLVVRDLVISIFCKVPSVLVKINNWFYNDRELRIQPSAWKWLSTYQHSFWHYQTREYRFLYEKPFLKTLTNSSCCIASSWTIQCHLIVTIVRYDTF